MNQREKEENMENFNLKDEAQASPRNFELVLLNASTRRATASEFLRMKGRPVNGKGSPKMIPMGKLRFFAREAIRKGKCHSKRRGGAEDFLL